MSASDRRNKSQAMAADLVRRGFYHGKRASVGLSGTPSLNASGSAAYRRRTKATGLVPLRGPKPLSLSQAIDVAQSHPIDTEGRAAVNLRQMERELQRR